MIQQYAERTYENKEAANSSMARRLGFILNLDPLSEDVNGKKDGLAARESLRALGEDG